MSATFFHGAAILLDGARREGLGVLCRAGRIEAVLPAAAAPAATRVALPPEALLSPGFIDLQVNGGGGMLFNDQPDTATARHIAAAHRSLGTTGILPTLITSPQAALHQALATLQTGQGVLGLHAEGPFLSPHRPGVHRPDLIRAPAQEDCAALTACAARMPLLLTLAPECVPPATQRSLAASGIILAAGHTAAAAEEVVAPITGVTHIFNAMPPLAARAPGPAGAALAGDFYAGVIMDGIHVHPAMLRLLLAAKPASRVFLVSDSMSVAGTGAREFTLLGRRILRREGRLTTEDGTLAGADIALADAVRYAVFTLGLPVETALAMATATPAAFMGLSAQRGRIAPGLAADFTLLSPALEVLGTMLAGDFAATPGALAA